MPQPQYPHLFSPFQLGSLTLKNRVVMAPMSSSLGALNGEATPKQIAFYQARAAGGTGMIIVEFCCVHGATGRSEERQLLLENDAQLAGQRLLVQAIRGAGSVACLQLQHGGQGAKRALVADGMPVTASDVPSRRDPARLMARALTHDEIEGLIESFGRTAEMGVQAGYQAFELHGAHGYLLTSFLSPFTNHRSDAWGGDEERRLAFPWRVIQRVKQAIGDRPLLYRLSADEFTPEGLGIVDMERIAPKLVSAGLDGIHVSIGLGWTSYETVIEPMSTPEGWRLPYARRLRVATGVPVIAVGQIRQPITAEQAVRDGDADLIALGRPLLADAQWAIKAESGRTDDIRLCTSCNYCITARHGELGSVTCAENPMTGRELTGLPQAGSLKGSKVIVVGAGPGGMAASLLFEQAGFDVELLEARSFAGGGLIASAAPPHKEKLNWYLDYLRRQVGKSGVHVRYGERADAVSLATQQPRLVVLAQGGQPVRMPIEGIDLPYVLDGYEILMGDHGVLPDQAGDQPILVYGGGETGCETAEFLAERGYRVILVSRSPLAQLARSAEPIYRKVLLKRLMKNDRISILENCHVRRFAADGVVTLESADGRTQTVDVLRVIIAQGRRPDPALANALDAAGVPYVAIGDARQGGRIGDAVAHAYAALVSVCASGNRQVELAC